jgi:hypothetical protein
LVGVGDGEDVTSLAPSVGVDVDVDVVDAGDVSAVFDVASEPPHPAAVSNAPARTRANGTRTLRGCSMMMWSFLCPSAHVPDVGTRGLGPH